MGISLSASSITQSSAYLSGSWSGYYNEQYGNYEVSITCNGQQVYYVYNGGMESASGSVTNLSPSTQYTANLYVKHDLGMASTSTTFTTPGTAPPNPIIPGIPTINSVTASGKNASINYSTGVDTSYIVIELSNSDNSWVSSFNSYSSPNSGTFPNYSTMYWVRAYGVSSDGHTSQWSGYTTVTTGSDPATAITVPTIGYLGVNGLTVDINFNIGSGNSYAEMEWYEGSTLIVAGNVYATPQPIQYTFAKANTQYKMRMRGMKGTYPNALPSDWTGWAYITTGYPAVTVNPPTLGTPIVADLTLTIPYVKGLNNQTLEFNIATISGNISSTNTDFVYTLPAYDTSYLVRARGVNITNGITTYSEWTTPWLTVSTTKQRPQNWYWTVAKVQGGAMRTVKQNSTTYWAYVLTPEEWNAFTDRIHAFIVYKKLESDPNVVTFNTVKLNDDCNTVIIKQAVDNINLLLGSTQLYYSEVITAQLFNDMSQKLNSIV